MNQSLEDQIQRLIQDNLLQKQALERHSQQLQEQERAIDCLHLRINNLIKAGELSKL